MIRSWKINRVALTVLGVAIVVFLLLWKSGIGPFESNGGSAKSASVTAREAKVSDRAQIRESSVDVYERLIRIYRVGGVDRLIPVFVDFDFEDPVDLAACTLVLNQIHDEADRKRVASVLIGVLSTCPESLLEFAEILNDRNIAGKVKQRWVYEMLKVGGDPDAVCGEINSTTEEFTRSLMLSALKHALTDPSVEILNREDWIDVLDDYPSIKNEMKLESDRLVGESK